MKPLNADEQGCDPISSNCVIWQGPDLACIGLCKGDSVSAVIDKLAKEICDILDSLSIDAYDISCLEIGGCAPESFKALIQVLITKICALEGIQGTTPTTGTNTGGTPSDIPIQARVLAGTNIPDAVMAVPEDFWYTNSSEDIVKQMQIFDVAYTAARKLDSIANQIKTINKTLENHEERIDTLENAPLPVLALPSILPVCVLPTVNPVALDVLTKALEEQFCELRNATGEPIDIYNALVQQCLGLGQSKQLQNGASNMNAIPGWKNDVTNFADSFYNMWLTVCDMRAAIRSVQEVVMITDCDELAIIISGVLTSPNNLVLFFNGTIPSGYVEAAGTTNITITDAANNAMTIAVPVTANLNVPAGYNVPLTATPINGSSDLIITVPLSYTDGENVCAKVVTEVVIATGNCPIVTLIPQQTVIDWSYTYLAAAASLDIKLFAADGVTLIQNFVNVTVGPSAFNGTFTGLVPGIQYKVRLEITPDGAPEATLCPFSGIVTLTNACLPVNNLLGSVIIT